MITASFRFEGERLLVDVVDNNKKTTYKVVYDGDLTDLAREHRESVNKFECFKRPVFGVVESRDHLMSDVIGSTYVVKNPLSVAFLTDSGWEYTSLITEIPPFPEVPDTSDFVTKKDFDEHVATDSHVDAKDRASWKFDRNIAFNGKRTTTIVAHGDNLKLGFKSEETITHAIRSKADADKVYFKQDIDSMIRQSRSTEQTRKSTWFGRDSYVVSINGNIEAEADIEARTVLVSGVDLVINAIGSIYYERNKQVLIGHSRDGFTSRIECEDGEAVLYSKSAKRRNARNGKFWVEVEFTRGDVRKSSVSSQEETPAGLENQTTATQ